MEKSEIDSHKLMYHPKRIIEWLKTGDCFPIYVEISPTNQCNHKCVFCGLDWSKGKEYLETKVLLKTLKNMGIHQVKSVCYSGSGEPLLHKNFSLLVQKTKEYGMDVAFSTNGVLFDKIKAEECLPYTSWIRFSVNAGTTKTYAKLHGTSKKDFKIILSNLSEAVKIKKKNNYNATLGVQILLLEENANEILKLGKICRDIGVDNLQIKPYSQNPNSKNKFCIDYQKFSNLENKVKALSTDTFKIIYRSERISRIFKVKCYDLCYGLSFSTIIDSKGNVIPCEIFYKNPLYIYGNIYKNKFSEIWKSKQRQKVLKKINRKEIINCKKGCRLDLINKYLSRLKNPYDHDTFI